MARHVVRPFPPRPREEPLARPARGRDGRGWGLPLGGLEADLLPGFLLRQVAEPARGAPVWEEDHWYWIAATDELKPSAVTPLRVAFDLTRKLSGTVLAPDGRALPDIRVQAFYKGAFPSLRGAYGFSVTHTRPDGTFTVERVGRGPYRFLLKNRANLSVTVKDIPDGAEDLRLVYDPM